MQNEAALMEEEIDTSYEPFSREPEYIDANRAFIEKLDLDPNMQLLDLACGTCTMTDLVLQQIFSPGGWPSGGAAGRDLADVHVTGIDLSRESLKLGRDHMQGLGVSVSFGSDESTIKLIEGSADALPLPDNSADFAIMGNAIQLVDDLDTLMSEVSRVLRPGGYFAFNTSFYAGTYCKGTEHVYLRWMQEATGYIRRKSAEQKAAGLPGVKRRRGTAGPAFSKPWLSSDDYAESLGKVGMDVVFSNERTVMLDQRCFETIGAYQGLAKVLMSGYPVKLASEALEWAAGPTLEAVEMESVPRFWLEMVGCLKP